ncbi:MAG: hypothetical protein ACREJC_00760 [Tepidisphaeraceae bacterium]
MSKISTVQEAADDAHAKMKAAKKAQTKDGGCCKGEDLSSHVYVIRGGAPEVLLICGDDGLKTAFGVGARLFAGDIVTMCLDGQAIAYDTPALLTVAADREGNIASTQQFYAIQDHTLSLEKPVRSGKPKFLMNRVKKDMREMMAMPFVKMPEDVRGVLEAIGTIAGIAEAEVDLSPEAVQAFLDATSAHMIKTTPVGEHGINSIAMIALAGSAREKALRRPGVEAILR